MTIDESIPPGVDPTRPSAGRMYDLFLGGSEHLEVDRLAGAAIREKIPEVEDAAWGNRGFLQRSARWLALEAGIKQFIDIGAGLPTRNNTHEAVQAVDPEARTVYVDNDPMILAHARRLLTDVSHTQFITGDLRDPDAILRHPELRELIDFSRPVALMLAAVTHFISDEDDPCGLLAHYVDALPSGSYLALSQATSDKVNPEAVERVRQVYANATEQFYFRSQSDIERFFSGLEMVPPYEGGAGALTYVGLWGADDPVEADTDGSRWVVCGVARKP